jgi:hypothetical protein
VFSSVVACGTCRRRKGRGWPATSVRPKSACWPPSARPAPRSASSATKPCWSTRLAPSATAPSLGPWPTGPSWPTPTARSGRPRPGAARRLHLSQSFNGGWALDALLDPINGAVLAKGLGSIEQELFEADWAEARSRVGDDVRASHLTRTPAQRRADALVEMARRAMAVPGGTRLPEPLFTVLVGYETFAGRMCELADGTVVPPGSLVRWLDKAWVERVVFQGPSRIKDVGVRRRVFAGATRRAVEVRDRECFHPLCEEPAERCEIDHVQPWAAGGLTVEANGRAACRFHNRERHRTRPPP